MTNHTLIAFETLKSISGTGELDQLNPDTGMAALTLWRTLSASMWAQRPELSPVLDALRQGAGQLAYFLSDSPTWWAAYAQVLNAAGAIIATIPTPQARAIGRSLTVGAEALRRGVEAADIPSVSSAIPALPRGLTLGDWNKTDGTAPLDDSQRQYLQAFTLMPRTPLAVDLDGKDIQTLASDPSSPLQFDLNGDGIKTATTNWLGSQDAWLARDLNGNGMIDSGKELFGVDTDIVADGAVRKAANSFEALSSLDANRDQKLDLNDAAFQELRLWRDVNGDAISQPDELSKLDALGITSISLDVYGGLVAATANGGTRTIGGVYMGLDSMAVGLPPADAPPPYPFFPDKIPPSPVAQSLPDMQGHGAVRSLREAMSMGTAQAEALVALVGQFAQSPDRGGQLAMLDRLIQGWGDTADLITSEEHINQLQAAASANQTIDPLWRAMRQFDSVHPDLMRKVTALERFNGMAGLENVLSTWTNLVPDTIVNALEDAYAKLREAVYGELVMQTRLQPYLDAIELVEDDTTHRLRFDAARLDALLAAQHANSPLGTMGDLADLMRHGGKTLSLAGVDALGMLRQWIDNDQPMPEVLSDLGIVFAQPGQGSQDADIDLGSDNNDIYDGQAGADSVDGGAGDDRLWGADGDDLLAGNIGNDTLFGVVGDDTLDGGAGDDWLDGGSGDDTYLFGRGSGQDVILAYDDKVGKRDTIWFKAGVRAADIEVRRDNDDLILGIKGTNDSIRVINHFLPGLGSSYQIEQVSFADGSVRTTEDIFNALGADLGGTGTGIGDSGVIHGTPGDDVIYGTQGADQIDGGDGNDYIYGLEGHDTILGGRGNDYLKGNEGKDVLDGGEGEDTLIGTYDDDRFIVDNVGDVVWDQEGGVDRVDSSVSFTLGEGLEDLGLTGTDSINGIGNALNNRMFGNSASNLLDGGDGDDWLDGGAGQDLLKGGLGSDSYVFSIGMGQDTIEDPYRAGDMDGIFFLEGIRFGDLRIARSTGKVTLSLASGESMSFGVNAANGYAIERIAFVDDGVVLGPKELRSLLNAAPTGAVSISGTARQGQRLTASNTLADLDGLGTITYQWLRNGASTGVTGASYVLGQADVGARLSVTASYKDSLGSLESITSAQTGAVVNINDAPTGSVMIFGEAKQGQKLSAGNSLSDVDGMGTVTYRWLRSGNATDVTGSVYTLGQADVGALMSVTASYTDGQGTLETVTSAQTGNVANVNDAPTGAVSISGTAMQGQTLTAGNTLADLDGLGTISYAWQRNGASTGVTGSSYKLSQADVGAQLSVTASYTDRHGALESVTSAQTGAVANINDAPTGGVSINGSATQGQTLSAVNTLADVDGLGSISYQWLRNGASTGITGNSYTLGQADVGAQLSVTASYTDGQGTYEAVTSALTNAVANINDAPTGGVSINGSATQGQTLSAVNTLADVDGLGSISYQWLRNGASTGITGNSYTLGQADVGAQLSVTASYTDGQGTYEAVTSAPTSTIASINKNLSGTNSADNLGGGVGDDTLLGLAGNDTLTGYAGNDSLDGGQGSDAMFGGLGDDTYVVDLSTDVVTENANEGIDLVLSAITYTLGNNIEKLSLTGTANISGTGNTQDNVLTGNSGANRLTGNSGNDTLIGGAGTDTLVGGTGNDSYVIDVSTDVITENANEGTDTVETAITFSIASLANVENITLTGTAAVNATGNAQGNVLTGNGAANTLNGGFGADTLIGGAGNDTLDGGSGADSLVGGEGNDVFYVDSTSDKTAENANEGVDLVYSGVTWTLATNVENLTLTGSSAINGTGNAQSNVLTGNSGANTLTGGGGDDSYRGGTGRDTLNASSTSSNDNYIWGRGEGADTLNDAGGTDQLRILAGVTAEQVWLRRVSNNLEVSVIGTSDTFTITNWYTAASNQVESFTLADGKTLGSAKVQNLVNAMAAFSPPVSGQTTLPSSYQASLKAMIASNWT